MTLNLNKRDQIVAWALGGLLGAFAIYYLTGLWWAQRTSLESRIIKLREQDRRETNLINIGKRFPTTLAEYGIPTVNPVRPDLGATEVQVRNAYILAGANSNLTITGWGSSAIPRSPTGTRDFLEAKYTASTTTNTARLARFLQAIESAHIAAKIDKLTITTPRPGVDNLRVDLQISALLYAPKVAATQPAVAARPTTTRVETQGSRPATSTGPETMSSLTPDEIARIEQRLAQNRIDEANRLATQPAPKPLTAEELAAKEQEMIARRTREMATTTTAPATAPTAPGGTR